MTNTGHPTDAKSFIAHLDAQLDMLIRRGAALEAKLVQSAGSATDPTGLVTVEFDAGPTLRSISVAPQWEQRIPAADLATVISETLVRARDEGAPVEAPVEPLSDEEVVAIRERTLAETRARQQLRSPEEAAELAQSLPQTLRELNAQSKELLARARSMQHEVSEEPVELATNAHRSENQMVAVEYVGSLAVKVSLKEEWLRGKSGIVVTECFAEAIAVSSGDAPQDQ